MQLQNSEWLRKHDKQNNYQLSDVDNKKRCLRAAFLKYLSLN